MSRIALPLIEWWRAHGRRFPWRHTRDPYRILVAEVLLHRTRAEQVEPVYLKLMERYPDVISLSRASCRDLNEILEPLGLRWRIRKLHRMARQIVRTTGGEILSDRKWLLGLPGVSDYIASAVRCFAFGLPEPLLDTNTVRITGRLLGFETGDSSRRSRRMRDMYLALIDFSRPAEFNYAMIDLGALICRPRNPACGMCPLAHQCNYGGIRHAREIHRGSDQGYPGTEKRTGGSH